MFIYTYVHTMARTYATNCRASTANLRTMIMHFRGFDSSIILILRGGIPRPIGNSPGEFESSNVSRDDVSREIGRRPCHAVPCCEGVHFAVSTQSCSAVQSPPVHISGGVNIYLAPLKSLT